MNQKWNLQDIRPAEPRRKRAVSSTAIPMEKTERIRREVADIETSQDERPHKEKIPNLIIEDGRKKGKRKILFSSLLALGLVGGALTLSALLGKTELTIYPQYREPNISSEFTAYPEARDGFLTYEILTLDATSESQVKASGQVQVEKQATGKIEISKTTPGTERLIKNTRFRSPDGKIFRIKESVVVPGAVNNTPGTIQADVFADEVGDGYNLPSGTKFDVPGFADSGLDELYKAIHAENKEAFSGGFKGAQFQIDDAELATARQSLQVKLRDELLKRIDTEKPAGFTTFPGAVAITYDQLPAVEYGQDLVTIREKAILQVPLFKNELFGSFLAKEAVATYAGGTVRVEDPTTLTFAYTGATTSSSVIANAPSLSFSLKGKPRLIWEYDAKKLTKDLAGLPKTAITNAVGAHPGIEGAKVNITPFWKRTFPENPEDIIIVEELKETATK
jgi:hypothetical protein